MKNSDGSRAINLDGSLPYMIYSNNFKVNHNGDVTANNAYLQNAYVQGNIVADTLTAASAIITTNLIAPSAISTIKEYSVTAYLDTTLREVNIDIANNFPDCAFVIFAVSFPRSIIDEMFTHKYLISLLASNGAISAPSVDLSNIQSYSAIGLLKSNGALLATLSKNLSGNYTFNIIGIGFKR